MGSHVQIEIFNMLGQKIRTLVDEEKSAGPIQRSGMDEWTMARQRRQACIFFD
jgi:hypothetical protein